MYRTVGVTDSSWNNSSGRSTTGTSEGIVISINTLVSAAIDSVAVSSEIWSNGCWLSPLQTSAICSLSVGTDTVTEKRHYELYKNQNKNIELKM